MWLLIAIALVALGLALIAVPRGSAQSDNGPCDPFVDTCAAGSVTTPNQHRSGNRLAQMSLARGRLAVAAVGADIVAIGGDTRRMA